ncbi:hypothetical protein DdX_01046 [Ditylenchus destructor]|uniref:Uncharacterized protein n=1 Tax=Ditylenchus destructor TaxID=166010 RepID=A0AAD4NG95_9BILA|nr:hypothetical protein DdX_01046 [Ditylenchus destructor]
MRELQNETFTCEWMEYMASSVVHWKREPLDVSRWHLSLMAARKGIHQRMLWKGTVTINILTDFLEKTSKVK